MDLVVTILIQRKPLKLPKRLMTKCWLLVCTNQATSKTGLQRYQMVDF